jgi:CBS domain containing-hemolysin-like protein
MDDYLVGMAVFLTIGLFTLFLSSLLANHPKEPPPDNSGDGNPYQPKPKPRDSYVQDTQTPDSAVKPSQPEFIEENNSSAYERLILRYQDRVNPFSQLEAMFYIIGFSFFGVGFNTAIWLFFVILGSALIALVFLRSLVYALGIRLSPKIFTRLLPVIVVIASATLPLSKVLKNIRSSIGGDGLTEDSRDEIETLVDSAKEEGSIEDSEYRLLKNIMSFSEVQVSDVMTPRTVVFSLPETTKVGDTIDIREMRNYSRIPIYSGKSLDEGVKGYVTARDVLAAIAEGNLDKPLSELSRKIFFVPDNLELSRALEEFLVKQQHMYIVVDEYGGVDGLITMEDVLETILGVEIVDEADTITDLRKLAKKTRDYRQKRKRNY